MKTQGGKNICGVSIGVLALASHFPKPPGHIKNPASLPFTTCYEILPGISVPELLYRPTQEMETAIIAGAKSLQHQGVRAITGSCGFLAAYQPAI
ncbi:MAG: aspartate/glutamate racemase family protein, partial [Gammaproteobacteria bacterium]|nr:aspartate/glutamate racemase family protein [Gammaproteobacteria bacterium]